MQFALQANGKYLVIAANEHTRETARAMTSGEPHLGPEEPWIIEENRSTP
jgi:hypothetical protein